MEEKSTLYNDDVE